MSVEATPQPRSQIVEVPEWEPLRAEQERQHAEQKAQRAEGLAARLRELGENPDAWRL